MIKKTALIIALTSPSLAFAQVYVAPTIRSDGTMVQGHMRTAPNSTRVDNWSSRPNVNPYTGRVGTADPYAPRALTPYRAPSTTYRPRRLKF